MHYYIIKMPFSHPFCPSKSKNCKNHLCQSSRPYSAPTASVGGTLVFFLKSDGDEPIIFRKEREKLLIS